MMGRLNHDQRQLFYSFRFEDAVPDDHLVRAIAGVLDLSCVHAELAPYYPKLGRHSIDPVLMIRMLVVGYVFAIRSERALCRDVQVNLAYLAAEACPLKRCLRRNSGSRAEMA
jgi:transposase